MYALGPRASLLLGLLLGNPKTAGELQALAMDAVGSELVGGTGETFDQYTTSVAIQSFEELEEVKRHLVRLEEMGYVDRVSMEGAPDLWSVKSLAPGR